MLRYPTTNARGQLRRRRGLSACWLLIWLPVLLLMFCFLINVANIWLARVELENAMESAALAAVKEWGDANGAGGTAFPREVGVDYAALNQLRCLPVVIGTNLDPMPGPNNPNENLECVAENPLTSGMATDGNLIFGAITDDDPMFPVTFNAGVQPSCGGGTVLFDATGQGMGGLADDNAWGVAFRNTPETPPGLMIRRIIIDLQAGGGSGVFDLNSLTSPGLSDNVPQHAVRDNSGNDQPDIAGFTAPAAQILFSPLVGVSPTLTIDFIPDPGVGVDLGFEPGDRFRFGARTQGVSMGNGQDDGDGIGRDNVQVTVIFTLGGMDLPPVAATFVDNTESSNDCINPALIDAGSGSLIVHPTMIPDLPCPASSAPNNNGQSFVQLQGSGNRPFAVRAQAFYRVPLFCSQFLGLIGMDDPCVYAKATAQYDCATRSPVLIRVDRFICPGP